MTAPNPPEAVAATKRNALLNLLDTGHNVTVLLDPRRPGTLVPLQFQRDFVLALVLGRGDGMVKPIPDLDVAEDGIGCTLSFNGRSQWCFLPWESVFRMQSTIGSIVWPEDMSPEMRAIGAGAPAPEGAPAAATPAPLANVISLDERRTPKDRRACARRLAALAKLTAPPQNGGGHPAPGGSAA